MSDEVTPAQPAAPASTAPTTATTPSKPADAWGQPISAERQTELQGYLDRWQAETDHSDRKGPFDPRPDELWMQLSGSDVSWLVGQSRDSGTAGLRNLHLEGADLSAAYLDYAQLQQAHLERANLYSAHLEGADLGGAHLEGTLLSEAHLEGAYLGAHLEGADLGGAHLERASVREAHLEGVDLSRAHLEGADLRGAWLDNETVLSDATLDNRTSLGDIHWSGVGTVDLTQINWTVVPRLGDEQGLNIRSEVDEHEYAVRAYRQLAAQLRAQGLSEVADRFAERAQVRQRKRIFRQLLEDWRRPWRIPGDMLRWLFSWFLALLAGYGYHPGRSVFWYLATIAGFAFAYYKVTSGWTPFGLPHPSSFAPLTWYEALVLSVSSFHGRGFLPFPNLGDPVTILAAIEAVFGLLIEISFIATFTQRFFGSR